MKVSEMFPSRYAKGVDLKGKPVTLKIFELRKEQMRNQQGKEEAKWVLYFEGATKGVILNYTIAQQIADVVGSDDTEQWSGKMVTLYPTTVKAFGKQHLVIRVRKPDNGPTAPPDSLHTEADELDDWTGDDEQEPLFPDEPPPITAYREVSE